MKNIEILDKNECTGCSACYSVCPVGAISMQENSEGFKEPFIDSEKCTNCGLCAKICPSLNPKYVNKENPDCYAYMASDEIRINSASGGAFAILAYDFIENDGYVAGAIWDDDWSVKHIVSSKKEDIEKMRSSKYLQSNINDCYKDIKKLLENNKKVLFTGTPCQVAGLKGYLQKEYENLYCVDLICHGIPSPKVFKKYLNENFENVKNFNFRDKSLAKWGCGASSSCNNTLIENSEYLKLFLTHNISRTSCLECKYKKFPRQGDITIGDFWGVQKYKETLKSPLGTSCVILNNKKGKNLLEILKQNCKTIEAVDIKYAKAGNPNLHEVSDEGKYRNYIYKNIENKDFKSLFNNVETDACDCMILNLWWTANYGACLSSYGIQCLMDKLNICSKNVNFTPPFAKKRKYEKSFAQDFANKYLRLTSKCKSFDDLLKLNDSCNTFIAGSDQIWHPYVMKSHHGSATPNYFLLDFVKSDKKKIAFTPSCTNPKFDVKSSFYFKHYLEQFDFMSIRETQGQEALKELFDIDSEQLIDGAFHIPIQTLKKMTEKYKKTNDYIAVYSLPTKTFSDKHIEYINEIGKRLNLPIKYFEYDMKKTVEEWLAFIKNSKFVVSNSYHAMVFAIIFNKNFLNIAEKIGCLRHLTVLKSLGIKQGLYIPDADFVFDDIFNEINWKNVQENIQKEILRAENWFINAYNSPIEKIKNNELDCINLNISQNIINEEKIAKLKKQVKKQKENLLLYLNKNKIYRNYLRCKILSKIMFGKKRKHYEEKRDKLKQQIKIIRKISI